METIADLALEPPVIDMAPASRYQAAEMDYGMTIGIERTPAGRLWACWVGGGDSDRAFMALAISDDDGQTWSPTRLVIDPHDAQLPHARRSLVATLWTDPGGRLWFFFDQAMTFFDGRAGNWAIRCDNPDADRPTWSAPRRIWHGCSLNKPIVLADGTWLLAGSLWDRGRIHPPFRESFHDLDPLRGVNLLASTDAGETWEHRGHVLIPRPDFDEANLVQRRDGSVWLTARTFDADIWESVSSDAGRTWSPAAPSGICNTNSRHFMRRLASGRILLVKNGRRVDQRTGEKPYTGRCEMTAFLSDDDGRSWQGGLVIDPRTPVTYPDGCQSPDGAIYVSYDFERETTGQILLAKFREADVLAGGLVSQDARLQQQIFRPQKPRQR